jgi:hypothetical protein
MIVADLGSSSGRMLTGMRVEVRGIDFDRTVLINQPVNTRGARVCRPSNDHWLSDLRGWNAGARLLIADAQAILGGVVFMHLPSTRGSPLPRGI